MLLLGYEVPVYHDRTTSSSNTNDAHLFGMICSSQVRSYQVAIHTLKEVSFDSKY